MDKMNELYEKVSADGALQAKFNAILSEAEKAGEAATGERLIEFAKEAGYEVSLDEMRDFFRRLAEAQEGELSDAELDAVAGGKQTLEKYDVDPTGSIASLGMGCIVTSSHIHRKTMVGYC